MPAQLTLLGNIVITVAYIAITIAIVVPLLREGQIRTNRLAVATALIFFSCAVGHAFHAITSWPVVLGDRPMEGMAASPAGWTWPAAAWDVFTAGVGVYYWTLRRSYGVLLGALYVDPTQRRLLDEVEARERIATTDAEAQRALLAAIVDQSDDAIVGTTLDGVVTAWNSGAERMCGYSAAEAVGVPLRQFGTADGVDHAKLLDRISTGERGIRYDAQVTRKDGSVVEVAVSVSPVCDSTGRVVGTSRVARDLTATKRAEASQRAAEERAHQVQRMASLGQLAGGVAHDFNNLLGIILNFTAFAAGQAEHNSAIQSDLQQVTSAAERAVGLARQLLVFTRQDTVQPEILDVNAAIAEAESMLARTIGEHIELIAIPSPTPVAIYADGGHIQQVLVNLAVNARDAMPDGGTLVIEAATADLEQRQPNLQPPPIGGRYVHLVASDTGCGMPPEVLSRIFEPFYTTKPRGQGTGLGLATVYGIVAEAGGSIGVESAPGVGTTVQVYFPLVDMPGEPAEVEPEPPGSTEGQGQRVLVVEDEPALGQVIARILGKAGYRTLSANSGSEALALDSEHGCDLLLTDVVMPEMSGQRVAELLRQRHPRMPVVYMSGYTDGLLDVARIREQGSLFIEKPFTAHFLLTQIRDVFTSAGASLREC